MTTLSEQLAEFTALLSPDDVPIDVVATVHELILDSVGVAVAAAASELGVGPLAAAERLGSAPSEASLFGDGRRLPAADAALVNGWLMNALDFDDTYFEAITHPSCCVLPAAFAAAEAGGASGYDLVAGALAGYEVMLRLVEAGRNHFFLKNHHTMGLLGSISSAVAACRVMRATPEETANAIGISASLGGGLLQAIPEGKPVKALRPGYSSHAGVLAARLATAGVPGPRRILEGELGLFRTYLKPEEYDLALLVAGLGSDWRVGKVAIKLMPGGHRSHYFVESARELQQKVGFSVDDIARLTCITSEIVDFYNFTPEGYAPDNTYRARFSVPFMVATALCQQARPTEADLSTDRLTDATTLKVAGKVRYKVEPGADDPGRRGRVVVELVDGSTHDYTTPSILGTAERPAPRSVVVDKFHSCVDPVLGADQARQLEQALGNLAGVADVGQLMLLVRPE